MTSSLLEAAHLDAFAGHAVSVFPFVYDQCGVRGNDARDSIQSGFSGQVEQAGRIGTFVNLASKRSRLQVCRPADLQDATIELMPPSARGVEPREALPGKPIVDSLH